MVPLINILGEVVDAKGSLSADSIKLIKQEAVNALTIFGNLDTKLSQTRRDNIVNALVPELKSLRKEKHPDSGQLFGDNVLDTISVLDKNNSKSIVKPSFGTSNNNRNSSHGKQRQGGGRNEFINNNQGPRYNDKNINAQNYAPISYSSSSKTRVSNNTFFANLNALLDSYQAGGIHHHFEE